MQRKQTLNKDAKTRGRVTQFPSSSTQYKKKARNRSDVTEAWKNFRQMTGLSDCNTVYKSLHPNISIQSLEKLKL